MPDSSRLELKLEVTDSHQADVSPHVKGLRVYGALILGFVALEQVVAHVIAPARGLTLDGTRLVIFRGTSLLASVFAVGLLFRRKWAAAVVAPCMFVLGVVFLVGNFLNVP